MSLVCSALRRLCSASQQSEPVVPDPEQQALMTSKPLNNRIPEKMQEVLLEKRNLMQKVEEGRWKAQGGLAKEVVLIGGDLFTVGYLGLTISIALKSSLTKVSSVAFATFICGEIAGLINIGVAFVSLSESIQAFHDGDWKLGTRLFLDFCFSIPIGVIMILTSLAVKVGGLTALSAFFAAHPWLLPTVFFLVSLPVISEIAYRLNQILRNRGVGADILKGAYWNLIGSERFENMDPQKLKKALSSLMEILQAEIGAEAAVESFELLRQYMEGNASDEQKEIARKKIASWNYAQCVRAAQQFLFFVAFILSMGALKSPNMRSQSLNMASNCGVLAGNAIPLYMDSFWPFKRNAPRVVPNVQ